MLRQSKQRKRLRPGLNRWTMQGLFSLEAAKEEMGVRQTVEECITEAQVAHVEENGPRSLRHIPHEAESLWSKVDHLLYLPVLGLSRPRDLY